MLKIDTLHKLIQDNKFIYFDIFLMDIGHTEVSICKWPKVAIINSYTAWLDDIDDDDYGGQSLGYWIGDD